MLDALKKLFVCSKVDTENKETLLQRAAALLMLEVACADDHYQDPEKQAIFNSLKQRFDLNQEEADLLLATAESEFDNLLSLQGLTRLLVEELDMNDRVHLVELLWEVALADDILSVDEDYMVRKIADLLYVSHNHFIKAKIKVQESQLSSNQAPVYQT